MALTMRRAALFAGKSRIAGSQTNIRRASSFAGSSRGLAVSVSGTANVSDYFGRQPPRLGNTNDHLLSCNVIDRSLVTRFGGQRRALSLWGDRSAAAGAEQQTTEPSSLAVPEHVDELSARLFRSRLRPAKGPAAPFPHRYIDEAAADRLLLKLLAELRCGDHLAQPGPAPPANVVVLSCPHPGATYYLEDVALRSARTANADFLALDYLDVLGLVNTVAPHELVDPRVAEQISAPSLRYAMPFKPSEYGKLGSGVSSIGREGGNSVGRAQDDDEDMEEDASSSYENSQFEEEEDDSHGFPEEDEIDFEWGGGYRNGAGGTSPVPGFNYTSTVGNAAAAETANTTAGNQPTSVSSRQAASVASNQQQPQPSKEATPKHGVQVTFSAADVSAIKSQLASFIGSDASGNTEATRTAQQPSNSTEESAESVSALDLTCDIVGGKLANFVRSLVANNGTPTPIVIYVKDLNEFNTSYSSTVGPLILESLVGCVDALRASGYPALLLAGATPSLTDPHPHEAPDPIYAPDSFEAQRADVERAEYYRTILSGERLPTSYRPRDGLRAPYRHILSERSNPVSTVYLPPPPLPENSLTSNTTSLLPRTDEDSPAAIEEGFLEWERTMALDRARRVAELNWRAVQAECGRRGIGIEDHVLGNVLAGGDPPPASPGEGRGWTKIEDALLIKVFLRYGNQWEEIAARMEGGRLPEACRNRWAFLVGEAGSGYVPEDAELSTFLAALREKLWSPEMIREVVTNANGVRLREAGGKPARTALTMKQLMAGVENERMNDPAYRKFQHASRIADKTRKFEEALKRGSKGTGSGRGDGGLAALADTVDNRQDSLDAKAGNPAFSTNPNHHAGQSSSHTLNEDGRPESVAIKNLLSERGYKLNAYEKKLLGCVIEPSVIPVGFQDLVLPPTTKLALQTLVTLPLLRPKLFSHGILQKSSFTGVLLFGPPGTGKTFLAKCVAKSGGARFMNIALSDVFDKYVGEGEKNVKAVFTLARKLSPCVVFVDEVDALFGRRRGDTFASRREVMNEFMGEWDGISGGNGGVIIMAATNRPFDLDDAVLRRMPRRILVDLPNEEARAKILAIHLKDEQLHSSVSLAELAKRTELYSGSDLRNVCISAALASVKENVVREAKYGLGPLVDPAEEDPDQRAKILKEMDEIDEWNSLVKEVPAPPAQAGPVPRLITKEHFDIALKEIPASLTDEMESLTELRKWDTQYGGGNLRKGVKPGWGFKAT